LYPRLLFAVPEMSQDIINNRDIYNVTLFFDDLLGYDNEGEADEQTQLEKWRNLTNTATAWIKTLQSALPTLRPDGVAIDGPAQFSLDSFAGQQRIISVIVTMRVVTMTSCGATTNFPDAIPGGIAWPPQDVVIGSWVKGEQEYTNISGNVLTWTENNFDLTGAWSLDVFMNGQRLASTQYTVGANTVTIDANSYFPGADIYIRGLWTV
jgi:hypothetical protein